MSATVNEPQSLTQLTTLPESGTTSALQPEQGNRNFQQLTGKLDMLVRYVNRFLDGVVNPAIKTFLNTCDSNPRVAAIVSTPALLAFALVIVFFVFSASALVLWSIFTIFIAVIFVIIGGLMSLFFKLVVVLLATIPLAGMATGLLVAANGMSNFIISKLPSNGSIPTVGDLSYSLRETDWKVIIQHANTLAALLLSMRDVAVTLSKALYSAFQTAAIGLNSQRSSSTENTPEAANQNAMESSGTTGASECNLTRRTPYQSAGDDENEHVQ